MPPQRFLVLLTHSSRPVDFLQCGELEIRARYGKPRRLETLPPLQSLASLASQRHYAGGLSLLDLELTSRGAKLHRRRYLEPGYKVQHATLVDGQLVLCFEDALMVMGEPFTSFPTAKRDDLADRLIVDPWFAGLHTAFQSGPGQCVVSASAPDAIMIVDLRKKVVTRRQRLPEALYGRNYDLSPIDSLQDHYIHNDLQLAHLNCAWPVADGSIYVSTLIQGDIGKIRIDGSYQLIRHGHVGCHAARLTEDGRTLYFADSCKGRIVLCDPEGVERSVYQTASRWLHDVQHVTGDLYLLCVADSNTVMLVDVANGSTLIEEKFDGQGMSVQFLSVHPWNGWAIRSESGKS